MYKFKNGESYLWMLPIGILIMITGIPLVIVTRIEPLMFAPLIFFQLYLTICGQRSGVLLNGMWKANISKNNDPIKFKNALTRRYIFIFIAFCFMLYVAVNSKLV